MGRATANLAGLAALAGVAYANRDKLFGSKGKEDTGPGYKSTETRGSSEEDKYPSGVMGGARQSDAPVTRSAKPKPAPEPTSTSDNTTSVAYPSGVMGGSKSSASPTYMSKTPGGDAKRTEGNQPMPSLKAVETRIASNKTDAMRNASRANVAAANRMKAMAANPESQAAERMYPESMLVGGPGIKTVGAAAKALANRGAGAVERSVAPSIKEIGMTQRGTAAETAAPRLGGPTPQLTGPSKAELLARDRAARASARQEDMLRENARRSGLDPDNINPAVANKVRQNMGGDDFSLYKKGGKVKKMASGGMTASRRGDGIASRGKTRGKIC
jgi:hypothetical protein